MSTKKLISLLLIISIAVIVSFLAYNLYIQKQNSNNNNHISLLTTSFTNISVQNAYNLIYNQNKNITIIDVPTKGITRYNESHLENAIMVDDESHLPEGLETLFYINNDILIYDDDGVGIGKFYCEKLLNHTYGKIYYMIGGFSEWKEQGYPYWYWNNQN